MSYQGWTNYETWAVALWIDNEEGTYNYIRDLAREIKKIYEFADALKDFIEENNPIADDSSLYSDLLNAAISEVNFREIVQGILQEIKEESHKS